MNDLEKQLSEVEEVECVVRRIEEDSNLAIVSFNDLNGEEWTGEMDLDLLRKNNVDIYDEGRFKIRAELRSEQIYIIPSPPYIPTEEDEREIDREVDELFRKLDSLSS